MFRQKGRGYAIRVMAPTSRGRLTSPEGPAGMSGAIRSQPNERSRYSLIVVLRSRLRSRQASTLATMDATLAVSSSGVDALKNSIGSATWAADGHPSSTIPWISGALSVTDRTTSLRTYRVRGWSRSRQRRLGAVPPGDPLAVVEARGPVDQRDGKHPRATARHRASPGDGIAGRPVVVVERLGDQVAGGAEPTSAIASSTPDRRS